VNFIFLLALSLAAQTVELGSIEKIKGGVFVIRDSSTFSARQKANIFNGDIIKTSGDGYAGLVLKDETRVDVFENSEFQVSLDSVLPESTLQKIVYRVGILIGRLRFAVKVGQPRWINVTTPTSALGVRGTEFNVLTGADSSSVIEIFDGDVLLLADEAMSLGYGNRAMYDLTEEKFEIEPLENKFDHTEWLSKRATEWKDKRRHVGKNLNDLVLKRIGEFDALTDSILKSADEGKEEKINQSLSLLVLSDDTLKNSEFFMERNRIRNLYKKRLEDVRKRWAERRTQVVERFEKRRKEINERFKEKKKDIKNEFEEKRKKRNKN